MSSETDASGSMHLDTSDTSVTRIHQTQTSVPTQARPKMQTEAHFYLIAQTTAGLPQLPGKTHQEFDAETMLLQNSAEVMNEFTVGWVARALASRSVFGNDVLCRSTFNGDYKRGLQMLDRTKVAELLTLIHQHPSFSHYSKTEFNAVAKKKIIPSIGHLCKVLRR